MFTNVLVDLHLHLDGSLLLDIVEELLYNQPEKKPEGWDNMNDEQKENLLSVPQECTSLDDYLKCFALPCSLLQTPDMVRLAMRRLVEKLDGQGLVYADIRFAPQLFSTDLREKFGDELSREQNEELLKYEFRIIRAALDGIEDAKKRKNIEANIILCCMRNNGYGESRSNSLRAANERTIELANIFSKKARQKLHKFVGKPRVVGIDLAGGEANNLNNSYSVLKSTYDDDLDIIIHSGEAGSLEDKLKNIESAILGGARRIGHGIALGCVYNENTQEELKQKALSLIQQIKERGIVLECCPTSNFQTRAIEGINPILKLLQEGIGVTINTDNMMVSRTTLKDEYDVFRRICKETGLTPEKTEEMVLQVQKNAIEASYMSDTKKRKIISCMNKLKKDNNNMG